MAIGFVTSSSGNNIATGGTLALDCTGSDLLLVYVYGSGVTIAQITSIAYNGTNLTSLVSIDQTYLTGGNTSLSIWGLFAPTSGSHNIVPTFSGGNKVELGAACYSGVLQSGLPDATANFNTNDTATSKTLSITTVASNCWTLLGTAVSAGSAAAGTGSTLRKDINTGFRTLFDSNAALAAGSNSMSWSYASGATAAVMVSFAPAAATSSPRRMMSGIGT